MSPQSKRKGAPHSTVKSDRQQSTLQIVYSRDLLGHAELCGCSPAQQGGLARQSAAFAEAEKKNPSSKTLRVDCGNFLPPKEDPVKQIHLAQMIQGYAGLKYDAINIGTVEAGYDLDLLRKLSSSGLPVTSASLVDASGKWLFPPYLLKNYGHETIALVGVVGATFPSSPVTILNPSEAIRRALSELGAKKPAKIVLLGDLDKDTAIDLANRFKELTLMVSAKDLNFSPRTTAYVATWGGQYGKNIGLVLLEAKDTEMHFEASLIALTSKVRSDERIKKIVDDAREKAESQIQFHPHKVGALDGWVGSAACQTCHSRAHQIWKGSQHSNAIQILKDQNASTRLDCVYCHVTGYKVDTGAYYEESVGCEACHGAGKNHIQYFTGQSKDPFSMKATSTVCNKCHTEPNSPLFSFAYYWEKIKH